MRLHWSLVCMRCHQSRGLFPQRTRPTIAKWECDCGAPAEVSMWSCVEAPEMPRLSGFSRSESDFTPHWNTAFGREVHSLSEMKAIQRQRGMEDAVVKGDGAERYAPRDIQRRIKGHTDFAEKVESGQSFETGRGVRVEFTEPGEDDD